MIVVDASAMVDVLTEDGGVGPVASALNGRGDLFAPSLLPAECVSAIWRMDRTGAITESESAGAIGALSRWPVTLIDPQVLMQRAWHHRHTIRISDGFYVVCAELLDLPLLTSDRLLARAATGIDVRLA